MTGSVPAPLLWALNQKFVVITDPGIRRVRPPETAVLALVLRVQKVRWVVGGLRALLSLSFTRGSREVACGAGFAIASTTHE